MNWQCEECDTQRMGEPAHVKKVAGYEGEIELWFCEECTHD